MQNNDSTAFLFVGYNFSRTPRAAEIDAGESGGVDDGSLARNDCLTPRGRSVNVRTMTKTRLLLIAGFLAACVCLPLGVAAMMQRSPGVTKANFDRLEIGMTSANAEKLLGGPANERLNGDAAVLLYLRAKSNWFN